MKRPSIKKTPTDEMILDELRTLNASIITIASEDGRG